jgi:hypothetical protein
MQSEVGRAVDARVPSGEQLGAGLGEPHLGAALVQLKQTALDG